MKIYIETNDFEEKCYCHLCGSIFIPTEVVARAYHETGEYITDVCHHCLAAGEEGISRRMRQRADSMRQVAQELERLARRELEAPTLEELKVANQMANALR